MRRVLALAVVLLHAAAWAQCPQDDPQLVSLSGNLATFQRSPPLPWTARGGGPWHIEIPAGVRVLVDADFSVDPLLPNIVVRDGGALVFADPVQGLQVDIQNIRLEPGASLIAGSLECPIENKLVITFHGDRPVDDAGLNIAHPLGMDGQYSALGHKGIGVCSDATIHLHGKVEGPSWTRLSRTASAGHTQLHMQQAVQWKSGDDIVIASTDFPSCDSSKCAPDQTEQRTVHSVSDNGLRVVLTAPLSFDHWGQDGSFAEVGLLTRHVVLQGDSSASSESFGGHLIMRKVREAQLRGVELTRFGQLGVMGRYPVHFHKLGLHGRGLGMYVQHLSLHHLFQRCITIHDTRHVDVSDNVAFHTRGHCYFLEDASEVYNTFVHNLGINALPMKQVHMIEPYDTRLPLPSDEIPSVFWITNPLNVFDFNAAVGSTFGYWFAMPTQPTGLTVGQYPTMFPRLLPLQSFRGNVAHSMVRNGVHIDDMQLPNDHLEQARYTPYEMTQDLEQKLNSSCAYQEWPCIEEVFNGDKPTIGVVFDSLVVYKCRDTGVWARGGPFEFTNSLLMDNQKAILCPPGPNLVSNSRIVAETSNRGVHVHVNGLDDYCFANNTDCRARPHVSKSDVDVVGYSMYDREGPQYVRNVELVGFRTRHLHCKASGQCSGSGVRRAGGYGHLPHGFNPLWTENQAEALSFVDSPQRVLVEHDRPNPWYPYFNEDRDGPGDGPRNFMFYDRDGSVSGWVGGWVQSDYSATRHASCETHETWNAAACPPSNLHRVQTHMVFTDSDISAGNFVTPTCSQDTTTCVSQGAGSSGCHLCDSWGMDYNRAHVYKLGDDEALPVTGIAYRNQFRRNFGANLPLRRGYAVRFNHPTPPLITIRAQSSAPGDWLVWVIPYPATALVMIRDRKNQPLAEATSLQGLDGDHFYREGEHVYIMLYVKAEHGVTEEAWGFHNEAGYARVRVEADCGKSCTVGGLDLAIPPALPKREDEFAAVLETCQADGVVTSLGQQGSVFATFNERSYTFQYVVHHNLGDAVTGAMVVDDNGDVVFNLDHGTAPVRGLRNINDRLWEQLYTGRWSFVLTTVQYPDGELKGRVGCVGSCTAPKASSTVDPCAPPGQVAYPFKGQNADGTSFAGSWQPIREYGAAFDISTAKDGALCDGIMAGAFQNNVANWQSTCAQGNCQYARAYWDLVPASGNAKYYRIDLNVYKYLHFHVRGGVDNPVWQLEVGFLSRGGIPDGMGWTSNGGYGGCCGKVVVLQEYMDNEYIDGEWTKVAIPLVDFSFPASGSKNIEDIRMYEYRRQYAGGQQRWFDVDEVYFSSEPGDFGGRVTTPPYVHTTGPCLQGGDATWEQRKVSDASLSQDCIGHYQDWGQCHTSCMQTQEFVVSRAAANGGATCPPDGSRECTDGKCKIDCQGTWSGWSQCQASCERTRTFSVTAQPNANGNACPGPTETQQCIGGACVQDCQGEFASAFGVCSSDCVQVKPFVASVQPANGGQQCPSDLERPCTGDDCADQDCVGYWDESAPSWADPSQCTAQCTISKLYVVTTPADGNGQPCPFADGQEMIAECSTGACGTAQPTATAAATTPPVLHDHAFMGKALTGSGMAADDAACEARCDESLVCAGFTFWSHSRWCKLVASTRTFKPSAHGTISQTSSNNTCRSAVNVRFDFADADNTWLAQSTAETEHACCDTCVANPACVAFHFKLNKRKCVLLSQAGGATVPTKKYGVLGRMHTM